MKTKHLHLANFYYAECALAILCEGSTTDTLYSNIAVTLIKQLYF